MARRRTKKKPPIKLQTTTPIQKPKECGICLEKLSTYFGVLENCPHIFCFVCINEWALISNTCPFCKGRFNSIKKYRGNKLVKTFSYEDRIQPVPYQEDFDFPLSDEDFIDSEAEETTPSDLEEEERIADELCREEEISILEIIDLVNSSGESEEDKDKKEEEEDEVNEDQEEDEEEKDDFIVHDELVLKAEPRHEKKQRKREATDTESSEEESEEEKKIMQDTDEEEESSEEEEEKSSKEEEEEEEGSESNFSFLASEEEEEYIKSEPSLRSKKRKPNSSKLPRSIVQRRRIKRRKYL